MVMVVVKMLGFSTSWCGRSIHRKRDGEKRKDRRRGTTKVLSPLHLLPN